jgi:SpoVK/Ycf46/Vps4 family AAA+-type ATPase
MHLTSVCKDLNTRFVFIPSAFSSVLSDPGFLPFAINSLNNSVLILEDAEEVLKDRAAGGDGSVSNILNITDGILGKLVKVKIIATVNKSHIIDPAITRKGRLRVKYEFEKLTVDKANKLFTKLENTFVTTEPLTLTEIYNKDAVIDSETVVPKRKIGFK